MSFGLRRTSVVGFFCMLREIELSLMLYTSVEVDELNVMVRILLPATKTDPEALSCSRFWGCVCDGAVDECACPYHAARAQKLALQERFGERVLEDGFPFAPMGDGSVVKK